jgi:hypothetical protein
MDTVSILQADLLALKGVAEKTTSLGELRPIEAALVTLETKVDAIRRFAPTGIRKRGLINAGGMLLKTLFGTATTLDLDQLQGTLDDLHLAQDSISHSFDSQITYFRQLGDTVTFDHQGLVNLSLSVRNFAEDAKSKFQNISSKFDWIATLRDVATGLRKLEFALFRLESYVDGYLEALQSIVAGRIPINIITPAVLQGILKNVSLHLPAGYALVTQANAQGLVWYYEFVTAGLLSTSQGFKLILAIPIRDLYRQFELYRLYTFPTEVINGTFVKFEVEHEYLAVHALQHTYMVMSEVELSKCPGREPRICAVDVPVYRTDVRTCALSLYLQSGDVRGLCRRTVSTDVPTPVLRRHGSLVVYHFTTPRQVHVRCQEEGKWESTFLSLHGPGTLHNVAACHITTDGIQLFPVLSGTTTFRGAAPKLYAPRLPTITSPQEARVLQEMVDTTQLQSIATALQSHNGASNLAAVLHTYTTPKPHRSGLDWQTWVLIAVVTLVGLYVSYYVIFPGLMKLLAWKTVSSPSTEPGTSSAEVPSICARAESTTGQAGPEAAVRFVKH